MSEILPHRRGTNPPCFRLGGRCEDRLGSSAPELLEDGRWLNLPVERLSWDDPQEFCQRAGLQLPSEAQWEYACRAGTRTPFAYGEKLSSIEHANFNGEASDSCGYALGSRWLRHTAPVGSYAANGFGLHDMHGNVWEWCEDGYEAGFYARPEAGGPDPVAREGSARVFRGSGYGSSSSAVYCRAAARFGNSPSAQFTNLGFRVARVP